MSPVSGRYPAGSSSTYSSTINSSTVASSSRPYGGLESVPSHPYSGNAPPDSYALSDREAQRSHRLPPPQSLVAGAPWASDTTPFRTHERRYHTPSAYHHQDGTGPNAPSPSPIQSPSLQSSAHLPYPLPPAHAHAAPFPPPPSPAAAAAPVARPPPPPAVTDVSPSHRAFPTQSVSDLPPPQRQPLPGILPTSRLPIDSVTQRYSQQPESSPSQASLYRSHQPQPPLYDGRLNIHPTQQHQTPSPAPDRTTTSRSQVPQPPSRLHRAENASPTSMIPNLLGPDRADALIGIKFQLRMRQQPHAARACGFGDRDRRVIDPPPIVQLVVESPYLSTEEVRTYLRYESYVMSCSIYDETGTRDSTYMPDEYQNQRRLMGSLISTPFVGQDENHVEGCFFCFSDLSCRTPGTFRLNFTLMMIDPSRAGAVKHFPILASTMSEPFKVFNAKEFPGMVASSKLAKRLKEQGCIISIKKGNERNDRGETSERNEGSERTERTGTTVRSERGDIYERYQRNERPKQSRPHDDLSDSDENSSHGQRKRRALEILAGLD